MTLVADVVAPDRLDAVAVALDRGEHERAAAMIEDLRRHEGPSPRLFALEARLESDRGRIEPARRLLERARALDPASPELRSELARLFLASSLPS